MGKNRGKARKSTQGRREIEKERKKEREEEREGVGGVRSHYRVSDSTAPPLHDVTGDLSTGVTLCTLPPKSLGIMGLGAGEEQEKVYLLRTDARSTEEIAPDRRAEREPGSASC